MSAENFSDVSLTSSANRGRATGKACQGPTAEKAIVVRALHKSGSMFLYRYFQWLSWHAGYAFFSANNPSPNQEGALEPTAENRCVCPLRDFEENEYSSIADVDRIVQIFHVRDPRDMIVSEYFSFGWTHRIDSENPRAQQWRKEVQKMTVDEYALGQPEFSRWPIEKKFEPIVQKEAGPNSLFVKYETMVTDFPTWSAQVSVPFDLRWPALVKRWGLWKFRNEFKVDGKHKRRITPGDHRQQLTPATIELLNQRYQPILERFGYSFD